MGPSTTPVLRTFRISAYTIPTDAPESDGTLEWDSTTIVVVEVQAGDATGLGFTYGDIATAYLIDNRLARIVMDRDTWSIPEIWDAMATSLRNAGRPGIGSMAMSAVDTALWDLKARLLDISLLTLLGAARAEVAVYGSGGFTSYDDERLTRQLGGWVNSGIRWVKMKVGRQPHADPERVRVARLAIGPDIGLFVDANGAYGIKQALALAERFAMHDVTWFEEPVSSDDLAGLARITASVPHTMEVAAGEYGYDVTYFSRMLDAGAVDVLQADATRCGGISGFLRVAPLCSATGVELSTHTAPSLHAHLGCAVPSVRHVEYFHDHVRIEEMFFDGAPQPVDGNLSPDRDRPGLGLELKRDEAAAHLVYDKVIEAA